MYISIDNSNNIKTNSYDKWYGYTKFDVINKIMKKDIDLTQILSQTNKSSGTTNSFTLKDITESRSPIKYFFDAIESMSEKENNNISPVIHLYEISLFKDEKNLTRVQNSKLLEVKDKLKNFLDNGMELFNEKLRDGNVKGDLFKQIEALKIEIHHMDKEKEPEKHYEVLTELENLKNSILPTNENIKIKMEYDIRIVNNKLLLEMPSLGKLINLKNGEEKYYLMGSKNLALYIEPALKEFSTFSQTFELGQHKNNMEKLGIPYSEENYINYLKENKIKKNSTELGKEDSLENTENLKNEPEFGKEEVKKSTVKDFLGTSNVSNILKRIDDDKKQIKVETPVTSTSKVETVKPTSSMSEEIIKTFNQNNTEIEVLDVENISDSNQLEKEAMNFIKSLEKPLEENSKIIDEEINSYKKEELEFIKQEEEFRKKQEEFKLKQKIQKEKIENKITINQTLEKQNNVIKSLTLSNLEIKEKYEELEIIKDNAIDETIRLEDNIKLLEEGLEKSFKNIGELSEKIEELNLDNKKLNENIEFLDLEVEKKDKSIEMKDKDILDLKSLDVENKNKIEILESENKSSNLKNDLLSKENLELSKQNTDLSKQNIEQKEMIEDFKELNKEFKEENGKLKLENSNLKTSNSTLEDEISKLKLEIEKSRKREIELENLNKELEDSNSNYKLVTETLTDEVTKKNTELLNSEEIIKEQKETIFSKEVDVSSKDVVIEELTNKLEERNVELNKKDSIIKDLNNELTKNVVNEDIIKKREENIEKTKMTSLQLAEEVNQGKKEKANPNEFLKSVTKYIETSTNLKP